MGMIAEPSDLELQVLSVFWETGPMTVRQLLDQLPDRKKRAYTTVLTVLQVMEKKGLVAHDRDGITHVYRAAVQRRQVMRPLMRRMLQNVFGGKPSLAVQYLVNADISADELEAIQKVIDDASEKKHAREGDNDVDH